MKEEAVKKDTKPDDLHFVHIKDEDNKKKEVDIKIVPVASSETKKGVTDLTISQDFNKNKPKVE